VSTENHPEVKFNNIKPEEEDNIVFGTILATNIQESVVSRFGNNVLGIFCPPSAVGNNPMEYFLRYKEKIVARTLPS